MTEFNINKIANALKKDFGTAHVAGLVEDSKDKISTGNKGLDLCLNGGLVFGHAAEFSGLNSTGKTSILQVLLADAQKKFNAIGLWIDRENAFFNDRATQLGIDLNNVIVAKPLDIPTVPDATRFIVSAVDNIRKEDPNKYIFIAIDSISAFESTLDIGKEDMGKSAKHVHAMFRKAIGDLDSKIFFGFTNQITYKTGVIYGDNKTTTMGEATKYYTTYRVQLTDKRKIVDPNKGDEIIGNWVEAEVIKTRRGPAYRVVKIPLLYSEGVSYLGGYIRLLCDRNYLKPKNEKEFNSYKQTTVVHPDGSNFQEYDTEAILKKYPELDFSEYPEYYVEPVVKKESKKEKVN